MGILKDGGITFILWMLPIRLINSAGDECTTVRDVSVVRGGTAELLCHIKHEKNDPSKTTKYRKIWTQVKPYVWTTVYWYEILDGNQIDYDATVPGTGYLGRTVRKSGSHDVVQLSKITDQDYGTYRCGWSVTPKVDGCAGAEASFNVTLLEPISNAHVSASSPKKEGESTVFTCSASGTSPITYTLHKVSGVTSGDRWSNASGVFTLSKIQRADAGEYRCTADNEAKRPQTSDAVTLEVYYAPRSLSLSYSPPPEATQPEKSQVTLTCTADGGHPAPDVTIYRQGVSRASGKSTATLTITLTKSDNQVALVCKATSAGITGQMSNEIKYNVQFAPVGVRMTQSVDSDGTSGKGSPVSVNSDVTLTCKTSSSSNPPVSLGWTRDGSTVTDGVTPGTEDGDHNAKVSTSQLRFRAQKQNNGNVYVCRVTTMTHLTDQTTLNVTSAPDRPTQPGIAYLSVLSVTLRWTAGFNGGFRQTFSVMYRVAGRTWPDEAQITGIPDPGENRAVQYKVGNLTQNTTYEFRVRAENERENGERTSHYTVTIQGKTKGKPTVVGNSLTVVRKPKSPMANASWAEPHGAFSAISISVCETSSESCRQHAVNTAVSNTTTLIRELHADKTYTYILQLYDNGDLVYSSQKAKSSFPNEPDNNPNHVFGALGGLLAVAVVVIVVLSLVVMVLWRRKSNHQVVGETLEQSHMYENTSFTRGNLEAMPSEKGGVLYENVKMMNSKTQETLDQLDAHNRARSRVITRDLSDGKSNNEIDGNQYEQLRIPRDQNVPEVEVYSQLQMMT